MATTQEELIRAFAEVAPDILGKKKWRRLVIAARRNLADQVTDNAIGPVAHARREALELIDAAWRLCVLDRLRQE